MTPASRWIYAVTFVITASGFLLPFWPLTLLGILLAALSGRYVFALLMGLIVDVAWGAPMGTLRYLFFPATLVALAAFVLRVWVQRYLFNRQPQEHL